MREIPEIFMPDSNDNALIEILVEEHERFDIFWYHWPHDGDILSRIFIREEDYEPVILLYDADDSFIGVITRQHWKYQDYFLDDGLDTPPKIVFNDEFHPPSPRTNKKSSWFDGRIRGMISSDLIPQKINSDNITEKFRLGIGHGSNKLHRIMDDPVSVSLDIIQAYDLE